jgi:hypothetical protein
MNSRQFLALIGVIGLLLCAPAEFKAQGPVVKIVYAVPDINRTMLFVSGQNFGASAIVSLADNQLSGVVVDALGNSLVAALPPTLPAGSYVLQISNGTNPGDTAEFSVTLGETHDLGSGNTATGVDALRQLTTGASNTALGRQALMNNTTGTGNIAIGNAAGVNLTTGDNNIAIGHAGVADEANTIRIGDGVTQTATYLSGVIHGDGTGLTGVVLKDTSTGNVGIGTGSPTFGLELGGGADMGDRTIGVNGVPMVYLPDQATFSGSMASGDGLRNLIHTTGTQGKNNTAVGINALKENTTGYFNTAVGSGAMESNTTGVFSVAVGQGALRLNTTGVNNTAVGVSALYSNTTANYNTAVGLDALQFTTTGSENTAIGKRSNWQNVTGFGNASVGVDSLYSNLAGSNNVAIGSYSLYLNTANNNVAIGQSALQSNTTGTENMALGRATLLNTATGSYNVAIGNLAGRYQADGATPLTSTQQSVYIGYHTRGKDNSDTNAIVIGTHAKGIGANSVVLGNDSILTTALKGNVGIGTTTPSSKLQVNGTADALAYKVGGTVGVSCSGPPTAGFTVVNGIITAC